MRKRDGRADPDAVRLVTATTAACGFIPVVVCRPCSALRASVPTLADVLEARRRIAPHLRPTPLYGYPALDQLLGAEIFVKHENHQPVGAFKVRGGVNLVSQLSMDERERGVIAASRGNHGQSIAYAGRLFGVPATIRDVDAWKADALAGAIGSAKTLYEAYEPYAAKYLKRSSVALCDVDIASVERIHRDELPAE